MIWYIFIKRHQLYIVHTAQGPTALLQALKNAVTEFQTSCFLNLRVQAVLHKTLGVYQIDTLKHGFQHAFLSKFDH